MFGKLKDARTEEIMAIYEFKNILKRCQ